MSPFSLHPQLEADSILIRDLGLSQLRLHKQKTVPWLILVPRRPEIREIYELAAPDRTQLMEEIAQAARALDALYAPDKINIAALGNMVPQLHVHVIARFTSDPAWPKPIWGLLAPEPYDAEAIGLMKTKLNEGGFWD